MEDTIFRPLNDKDKLFIEVDLNKPRYQKTAKELFEDELSQREVKINSTKWKDGEVEYPTPFAKHVARDDFTAALKSQIDEQLRMYGRIEFPEKLKVPEMKWDKYSNLNNFELIEEGEKYDEYLTKKNPGLMVEAKWKKFRFKGYGDTYRVMEDGPSSIKRAQEKLWKSRQQFENK